MASTGVGHVPRGIIDQLLEGPSCEAGENRPGRDHPLFLNASYGARL